MTVLTLLTFSEKYMHLPWLEVNQLIIKYVFFFFTKVNFLIWDTYRFTYRCRK